jgi:hypothetical protein
MEAGLCIHMPVHAGMGLGEEARSGVIAGLRPGTDGLCASRPRLSRHQNSRHSLHRIGTFQHNSPVVFALLAGTACVVVAAA